MIQSIQEGRALRQSKRVDERKQIMNSKRIKHKPSVAPHADWLTLLALCLEITLLHANVTFHRHACSQQTWFDEDSDAIFKKIRCATFGASP